MTFKVNLWDVDGCIMPNQFPNGKMNADITKDPPFPWVHGLVCKGDVNIMVSGRGSELKDITLKWWDDNTGVHVLPMYYVGVDWAHQATHDQRMDDYMEKKASKLIGLARSWDSTLRQSNVPAEIDIYEDDAKVLLRLATYAELRHCPATCWIVVNGAAPVKYEVKV
jgi:hypothetical protein